MTPEEWLKVRPANMRRGMPVGIIHSGGRKTVFGCAICGATHTTATAYRGKTRHEKDFISFHNAHSINDIDD